VTSCGDEIRKFIFTDTYPDGRKKKVMMINNILTDKMVDLS